MSDYCPSCHNPVDVKDANFCDVCGCSLEGLSPESDLAPEQLLARVLLEHPEAAENGRLLRMLLNSKLEEFPLERHLFVVGWSCGLAAKLLLSSLTVALCRKSALELTLEHGILADLALYTVLSWAQALELDCTKAIAAFGTPAQLRARASRLLAQESQSLEAGCASAPYLSLTQSQPGSEQTTTEPDCSRMLEKYALLEAKVVSAQQAVEQARAQSSKHIEQLNELQQSLLAAQAAKRALTKELYQLKARLGPGVRRAYPVWRTTPRSSPTEERSACSSVALSTSCAVVRSTIVREPSKNVTQFLFFGHYPQSSKADAMEPIEWRVLEKKDNVALIVPRYVLDVKPYHHEYVPVTWETCDLRRWLNSVFFETAFSPEEQQRILVTEVVNEKNPWFDTPGGNDTQDRVFLLSIAEAEEYFANNADRATEPTSFAMRQGARLGSTMEKNMTGLEFWWLRSPALRAHEASGVPSDGDIGVRGVAWPFCSVRPAIRITLPAH